MPQTDYLATETMVAVQQVHRVLHLRGKAEAGNQRQIAGTRISQLNPAAIRPKDPGKSIQCCAQELFRFTVEGQCLTYFSNYGKNIAVLNRLNPSYLYFPYVYYITNPPTVKSRGEAVKIIAAAELKVIFN